MKQLITLVFLLICASVFSQVEIKVVKRTGSFLMKVEIEGQKIGSLAENATASVTVDVMDVGPHFKANYRNKTFVFPQGPYEICGNDMQNHRKSHGSYTYAIILLKDQFGEDYLSFTSNL
jgi:hypothetical protein